MMDPDTPRLPYAMLDLVPHREPYVLLDHIVATTDTTLHARAVVMRDSILLHHGVASPIYGIELIAQAVAAYAGVRSRQQSDAAALAPKPPSPGFIVSCRSANFAVEELPLDTALDVRILNRWGDGTLGQFSGSVWHEQILLVQAELGVYNGDTSEVFEWQGGEH